MRGTLALPPAAISMIAGLLLSSPAPPMRSCLCGQESVRVIGELARTYAAAGDIERALVYQRRANTILERQIGLDVATGSERQKLEFVRAAADRTDQAISLHLEQ